jgi:pentatricopeptide repeat protein
VLFLSIFFFFFFFKGVRPNVVSYNTVISSLANARGCSRREMERAQEVFDQMVQQGVRPDITTFNALIHGHATMRDLETVRTPPPLSPLAPPLERTNELPTVVCCLIP